jgi:diguanylate cyclase (GGDEF)-like protein
MRFGLSSRRLPGSRVARRVFLLCVLCSLLPTLAIGTLVYTRIADQAAADAHATLQDAAKRYGLLLQERLERAAEELIDVADRRLQGEDTTLGPGDATRISAVNAVFLDAVPADARSRPFRQSGHLSVRDGTLRLVKTAYGYTVRLRMLVVDQAGKAVAVTATVSAGYLWNTDVVALPGAQLCVHSGAALLNCSGQQLRPEEATQASWDLFLLPTFGATAWTISAAQPKQVAQAELASVRQGLPLLAAAALLVALLVGSLEVRRTHGPLSELLRAFRVMARGRFVQVGLSARRDEYFSLGRAFNQLSRTLRRQFRLLATLERMDKAILDRPAVEGLVVSMLPRLPAILDCECVGIAAPSGAGRLAFSWVQGGAELHVESRQLADAAEAVALLNELQPDLRWEQIPLRVGGVERGMFLCGWRNGVPVSHAIRHQAKGVARRFAVALRNEERERQLLRQALEDELTRLPNRRQLRGRVRQALEEAASTRESFALVYLDLDRFKTLNDSLGHRFGDELLYHIAGRLSRCVGPGDTVARIGGDEFALLLRNVTAAEALLRVESTLARIREPVRVSDVTIQPQASVGIAMYPANGLDFDTLLRNADVAMYRGKASGGGRIVFFEKPMEEQALRRLQIESGLRQALGTDRLQLHYQPKVTLSDGGLDGVEALLRWTDPVLGPVGPDEFIPVAEESGLIQELGRFALGRAVGFCRQCIDASVPVGHVAVNVSMLQLRDAGLVDFLAKLLATRKVPAPMLQIEVTESSIMRDAVLVQEVLGRIRALGIRIAIDDFGTGYSSLAVLQNLPVDLLKIDRGFVARMEQSAQSLELVRAMLAVCRALGLRSIAEGVESAGQHALLAENGCDHAQGYLYSRPLAPQAAMDLIHDWPLHAQPAPWIMSA